ncbi:MAG: ketol-acid reductoisomerase [Candidatus Eremiobacteraeota bacterium]|nr:ketol-acid reductoisomerase [Candidatus Eremiobacteraeota bacterium]
MQVYYERDADMNALAKKRIAIIGYGSQGHAQARNLADSGFDVVVGLREGSSSIEKVQAAGIQAKAIPDAVKGADVVMILIPDEEQPAIYVRDVAPNLKEGAYLGFSHGFSIRFGTIVPKESVNIFMVAPKGPGRLVRSEYEAGRGVPSLIAIQQDPSGDTRSIALAYASATGAGRAGILETTFAEETETDLFGEQSVLCGGVTALIAAAYETLTDAGYAPEMAYFECVHELKLIVDLIYERGIEGMRGGVSNTAKYGDYTRGPRVIGEEARAQMRTLLADIRSGAFAQEWVAEHAGGKKRFDEFRRRGSAHPLEAVGRRLRAMMPWMPKQTEPKEKERETAASAS